MKQYAYLVCVEGYENHNKFYEAIENDDGSIDVNYGRVGNTSMSHHYAPWEKSFSDLIWSKERKGYKDVTNLHSEKIQQKDSTAKYTFKPIKDEAIKDVIDELVRIRRQVVMSSYTKPTETTRQMIDCARDYIAELKDCVDNNRPLWRFTDTLKELYCVIPRRMENVDAHIPKDNDKGLLLKYIDHETKLLDSLEGTLAYEKVTKEQSDKTVLENMGIEMETATYEEEDRLKVLMNRSADRSECLVKAIRITNTESRKVFEDCKKEMKISDKDCKLLFHGSSGENWMSILENGLVVNADRKGLARGCAKGLGNGVYFADDICKALNYTRDGGTRYIGVFDVALGKTYNVGGNYIGHTLIGGANFSYKDLPAGCQSTFLEGAKISANRLNEYCVYKAEQICPAYLLVCEKERTKDVRFSMKLSVPFKGYELDKDTVRAEAELSDYARKELSKLGVLSVQSCTAEWDDKAETFTLYINDKPVALRGDEYDRLFRDFKKSLVKSEKEWNEARESGFKDIEREEEKEIER